MKQLMFGVLLGSLLTTGIGLARDLYDSKGNVQAPRGSQQSYDYFRQRQQQLDVGALRRQADQAPRSGLADPCAR
jgi:hypothetical protein